MNTVRILLLSFLISAFTLPQPRKVRIWLIGDSTMANKDVKAYPETGWGMPFANFFDSSIVVDNRARNGRSTKTFLSEGLWKPVTDSMQEGDYVFIQFGHNDEVFTKASYTPEKDFETNLARYVADCRARRAIPVLITPVARRKFDSLGRVLETHAVYATIIRNTAARLAVPLLDLDAESQALLQKLGDRTSMLLYNHLAKNEHPNYPDGKADDTHFNELGARLMAEIILADIRTQLPQLAAHIMKANKN